MKLSDQIALIVQEIVEGAEKANHHKGIKAYIGSNIDFEIPVSQKNQPDTSSARAEFTIWIEKQ